MKNKKLTDTVSEKYGELFTLLWMLDFYKYVYYDDDSEVSELETHLNENKIKYSKGKANRSFITIWI